jgi:hypothetical protein
MTDKKSFILYYDLCKIFSELTDEQAGQLIKEIANYAESKTQNNPNKPTALTGLLNAVATPFKNHIDRDFELWIKKQEINSKNGKNGGRPARAKTQNNPNKGVTVTDTVTVSDNVNVTSVQKSGTELKFSIIEFIKIYAESESDKQEIEKEPESFMPPDCEMIWKGKPEKEYLEVWVDFVRWHKERGTTKTKVYWLKDWADYSTKNRSIKYEEKKHIVRY